MLHIPYLSEMFHFRLIAAQTPYSKKNKKIILHLVWQKHASFKYAHSKMQDMVRFPKPCHYNDIISLDYKLPSTFNDSIL